MRYFRNFILFLSLLPISLYSQSWVSATTPLLNALDVPKSSDISVTFDRDISEATLSAATIKVAGKETGFYTATFIYNATSRVLNITPASDFRTGEIITITLTTAIEDVGGQGMPQSFAWQFTTAATDGLGRLTAPTIISVSGTPYAITSGDWNNDGTVDLATANRSSSTVSILLNDGSGSFSILSSVSAGATPEYLTTGDYDNNGSLDIAVASAGSNAATILSNAGSGSFSNIGNTTVVSSPHGISSGDFNGDGDIDLAASNFSGNGSISILDNNGAASFSQIATPAVGNGPEAAIVADLNNDGSPDLTVPNFFSGNIVTLLNDGSGSFSLDGNISLGFSPHLPTYGDLNGDGDVDIVATISGSSQVAVLENDGGDLSPGTPLSLSGQPWSGASADLDSDGDLDLLITTYSGNTLTIWENDGNAGFTLDTTIATGIRPHRVVTADFNNDGAIDAAVTNEGSNNVYVFLNQPAVGIFSTPDRIPTSASLSQNYPNPFNPVTTIDYQINHSSQTELAIYDVQGNLVNILHNGTQSAGSYSYEWQGRDLQNNPVASGVYIYRLHVGDTAGESMPAIISKKMIFLQ